MEVDNPVENQLHSCPRDFVKPMSLVMDDHGSQPHPRSSGLRYVELSLGLPAVISALFIHMIQEDHVCSVAFFLLEILVIMYF